MVVVPAVVAAWPVHWAVPFPVVVRQVPVRAVGGVRVPWVQVAVGVPAVLVSQMVFAVQGVPEVCRSLVAVVVQVVSAVQLAFVIPSVCVKGIRGRGLSAVVPGHRVCDGREDRPYLAVPAAPLCSRAVAVEPVVGR